MPSIVAFYLLNAENYIIYIVFQFKETAAPCST